MATPKFSVSQITTLHSTYDDDLANYPAAGAEGIGIWEFKLPEGDDANSLAKLRDSGLTATTCIAQYFSIWPIPLEGPNNPRERTESFCASIRRLAPFEPQVLLVVTGNPGDVDAGEARRVLVDGLRAGAKVAAEYGLTIGVEPLHRAVYRDWAIIYDIPSTIELIDEVGEPNLAIMLDVYHVWDTDDVVSHIVRYGDRIAPSVHICDWRAETRTDFDRVLPGDGIIDLPELFGALEAGGWEGWVDLEIFSDDGTFTDTPLEGSLWQEDPVELVKRGKAGFEQAWTARKPPT
jgi:sugar phosphate isomerase/epimerase